MKNKFHETPKKKKLKDAYLKIEIIRDNLQQKYQNEINDKLILYIIEKKYI